MRNSVITGLFLFTLLIGFQNCGKTDFRGRVGEQQETLLGVESDEPPVVSPESPGSSVWTASNFMINGEADCTGARYISYSEKYKLWIGAQLCGSSNTEYKLYLSSTRTGVYLQIGDFAGHGQDHCELVNPNFRIPNEDDITSGGCTNCSVNGMVDLQNVPIFARDNYGQPFKQVTATFWSDLTSRRYQCGVAIGTGTPPPTATTCKAERLSLSYQSNQGYGLETYTCAGPMPETRVGTSNIWGSQASPGNQTDAACRYGNMTGAHAHILTSPSAGTCEHYCTLIADCGTDGVWKNIRYTW